VGLTSTAHAFGRIGYGTLRRVQRDEFWAIVESARAGVADTVEGADEVAENVVERLAALPPAKIVEYQQVYEQLDRESYRWDLWAAAYLIHGGCSDDCFDYFRGWLVAQGREVWDRALADPDSLADVVGVDVDVRCEDMLGAAYDATQQVTGDGAALYEALDALGDNPGRPDSPAGEDFDFDDPEEMDARLPRLAAVFLDAE
jgi:hypothetical protein